MATMAPKTNPTIKKNAINDPAASRSSPGSTNSGPSIIELLATIPLLTAISPITPYAMTSDTGLRARQIKGGSKMRRAQLDLDPRQKRSTGDKDAETTGNATA